MNKKVQKILFSSNRDDWQTPQKLYEELNKLYGPFTLDAASSRINAKCKKYYTENDNALEKDWSNEIVFVNPPYGRNITGKWVKKGYEESKKKNTKVVMLLPSRTSNGWFCDYCIKAEELIFIKGRLRFIGAKNDAPFPSIIAVFNNSLENKIPKIKVIDK